ncbi:uncharacterized protein N7458_008586 [Penicillium daleae]|uniref:Uncharacterized protein n=1 Tax=Penicillium daleae TaxID=63821 RepID=A0AAD6G1B5_9EURO|nr:uncharacterized protein N7458_008586 [Penicillium daleae]KAJ5444714.1 hypothetical protein N7458_008586 [Penicillium daleae]
MADPVRQRQRGNGATSRSGGSQASSPKIDSRDGPNWAQSRQPIYASRLAPQIQASQARATQADVRNAGMLATDFGCLVAGLQCATPKLDRIADITDIDLTVRPESVGSRAAPSRRPWINPSGEDDSD